MIGEATREHRWRQMRELMDSEGVDALAFTSAAFFQFATNFSTDVRPWERPIICVVARDDSAFVLLNELSLHHWRFRSKAGQLWVSDAAFYAEHPGAALPLVTEWLALLASKLAAVGLSSSRVGFDAPAPSRLKEHLPHLQARDLSSECRRLRLVKHAEELAVVRAAAAIADWTQNRYRENIRPGRLLQELDSSMAALAYAEAAERFPGEELQMSCFTLSGPASAAPH